MCGESGDSGDIHGERTDSWKERLPRNSTRLCERGASITLLWRWEQRAAEARTVSKGSLFVSAAG